jgi:hypothetical protein
MNSLLTERVVMLQHTFEAANIFWLISFLFSSCHPLSFFMLSYFSGIYSYKEEREKNPNGYLNVSCTLWCLLWDLYKYVVPYNIAVGRELKRKIHPSYCWYNCLQEWFNESTSNAFMMMMIVHDYPYWFTSCGFFYSAYIHRLKKSNP